MTVRLRDFLFLAALAAASPAMGQALETAAGQANTVKQSAASIPDFSGIWSHPYLTGFEIPFSGPGPVLNKSRLRNGVANFQKLVGDHANPILQPWAAEVVRPRLSHAEQSVLARRRALRVLGFPSGDVPAGGPHHDGLPPRQ
jgi:hypothetical protein